MEKEKNEMKNEKFSGMLLVMVLAFLLVPGASARPTYDRACQNCHPAGGTVSITNVAIASTTVDPGQVFNADVSWNGGSSGSTTVKWPSVAANNNLFTFNPVQRDYTVTSGASSFAITAPSAPGTYTIRVYAVTGPNTMESDYRDIAITVNAVSGSTTGQVLKDITVTPETENVVAGQSSTFIARALDQFNKAISVIVTWASSNTAVGTIDSTGKFTALSEGATIITATNGTISDSASVIVKSPDSKNKDDEHEEREHKEIDHEHQGEKHGDKHEIEEDEDEIEED